MACGWDLGNALGAGNVVSGSFRLCGITEVHFYPIDTAGMVYASVLLDGQQISCYENRTDPYEDRPLGATSGVRLDRGGRNRTVSTRSFLFQNPETQLEARVHYPI
jgi:hypothetical protein